MEDLNRMLREKCQKYLSHQIRGKEASVGTMFAREKVLLYPLPGYPFVLCKSASGRVDRFCTVRFATNNYSVPAAYCGRKVAIRASPETVPIYYERQCIAHCLERKTEYLFTEALPAATGEEGASYLLCKTGTGHATGILYPVLQNQKLSPKELVAILRRCLDEVCETIMSEASCHIAPMQIEDTVVVQAVDLHV